MTQNELYSWIASYTVANDNYMRLVGLGKGHDYYNVTQSDESSVRSAFGIPSNEVVLSFLQSMGLFDAYRGVVFTDCKVYYKDNLGSVYSYEYSANSNFYSGALAFDADKIKEIMNDIYEKMYEYSLEVAEKARRKQLRNIGAIGTGVATILAAMGVLSEVETQKSDALESGGILDLLNELADIFK